MAKSDLAAFRPSPASLARNVLSVLATLLVAHQGLDAKSASPKNSIGLFVAIPLLLVTLDKTFYLAILALKALAVSWLFWRSASFDVISLTLAALILLETFVRWPGWGKSFLKKASGSNLNNAIKSIKKNGKIEYEDLQDDSFKVDTERYALELEKNLGSDLTAKTLFFALIKSFPSQFGAAFFFKFASALLGFLEPWLIGKLIHVVNQRYHGEQVELTHGIFLAFAIFFNSLLESQADAFFSLSERKLRTMVLKSVEAVVYKKIVRLSPKSREEFPVGKVLTLLSSGLSDITLAPYILIATAFMDASAIVSLVALWNLLGFASIVGISALVLFVPLNKYALRQLSNSRKETQTVDTQQTQRINDLFASIKAVKLYAWEHVLLEKLIEAQETEVTAVERKSIMTSNLCRLIWTSQSFIVSLTTLSYLKYVSKAHLTPEALYPIESLLKKVERSITMFPMTINIFRRTRTAFSNVALFLNAPELESNHLTDDSDNAVVVLGVSFDWTESGKRALHDITLQVKKGETISVVGKVGLGKTALLLAILGELQPIDSKITRNGLVAYVGQDPSIFSGTLRENVLFGLQYDEPVYKAVLTACQLDEDISRFPENDLVLVGEKGINLSGGQKARIALARAVYSGADIYILDDVLSAVDNHVGFELMKSLFVPGGLLDGKTVIASTNNDRLISISLKLVFLEEGVIEEVVSFDEAVKHPKLSGFISGQEFKALTTSAPEIKIRPVKAKLELDPLKEHLQKTEPKEEKPSQPAQTNLPKGVIADYADSFSILLIVTAVTLSLAKGPLEVGSERQLAKWVDGSQYSFVWYAIGGVVAELAGLLKAWFDLLKFSITVRNRYFRRMARGLAGTSMRFFDKTQVGDIISRFNQDCADIEPIPQFIFSRLELLITAGTTVAIIAYNTPAAFPFLILVGFGIYFYQSTHSAAQTQFSKLSLASRAPITSIAQQTYVGAETIRAYGSIGYFAQRQHAASDFEAQSALLSSLLLNWLSVRLLFFTSAIVLSCSLSFVLWGGSTISGGLAVFVLSYAEQVASGLKLLLGIHSGWSSKFLPVEKCLEFVNLEAEENRREKVDIPSNWPSGDIVFENFSATYEDDEQPVLKNLNLTIKAGEKIGIVGRTGAGKSSIVLALFRMLKPTGGRLLIGGIDVEDVRLQDLRAGLGIIPQDSLLFVGSIRENIDPLGEYLDDAIWEALADSHLKSFVESLGGLDSKVGEAGSNFSGGQKQLLCLTRALLKDSGIVLMDEATASVDLETEKLVREVIAKKGVGKTVITIAHRTETVLDLDKVLGLADGQIKEFDAPLVLLKDLSSLLHGLVHR
ncbi:hypothetical protein C7M61_003279 [Candidozyma pseudohaemuli]|uniref:P-loop containing nucleoside triphosphate hydrolase protein n=1 Tax=Candidozyma pseudohaemuli TaxID=418784 RepID=A0A2P7YNN9_9ASCO|nr:hypothetical protein C7M61_003279 [[Candida] pseudohaemulonii]PSK37573.1 hypothetical protein C7M61_003279 [[Candida] pseudohaemulonii]